MPNVAGVQSGTNTTVTDAIGRAARRTGVDFDFLLAEAKVESALNPAARAPTSSAAGLYQFTSGTWLDTLERHGAAHGLGWASDAIERRQGRAFVADPAMRQQLLALRHDPEAASLMAAAFTQSNSADMQGALGRAPDQTELYLAHFLGSAGAIRFVNAHNSDAGQSAAALFPSAAEANRSIFYDGGRARGIGEVRELFAAKLEQAGGQSFAAGTGSAAVTPFADRDGFAAPAGGARPPARAPMSDVLRASFGMDSAMSGRAARHVAAAYGKLAGAGL